MNTKNLIIAFITVSVAALIVSAFAVFAAARSQYAAIIASAAEAEDIGAEETTDAPETTHAPETSAIPESTEGITGSETLPEETSAPDESTEETLQENSTYTEERTSAPSGYTLMLDGDRLVVTAPDGTPVSERIINASALHPKDREALLAGISFPDESGAISAIYDIIS